MRFAIGYQVLGAVLIGIAVGLFFGPLCRAIEPIGSIYIMLLQMIALPYIWFSLIHGLGSMTPASGKKIFKCGWPFWLILWLIIFIAIYLLSLLIPKPSQMTVEIGNTQASSLAKNFLSYLVPENPFYDLVNNIVPGIAIFGLILGIALMHLEKKEPILSFLERSNDIIEKILKWLAILSPIGVFAHITVAMGTVYFKDLYALEFYIISFILITLFISFWTLPALLSSMTPLTYKETLKAFKTVCLLPFATALPTIALPFIVMYMKKLGIKHAKGDPHFHSTSQTVMPICYSFGQIGNCMILFFILFLSFYFRHPFSGAEKAILSILTIPMSIGSSATSLNAVAFLIQQLQFPKESITMFIQTMAITLNFQVLVSTASILTLIILILYAYFDLLEVKWRRLAAHFGAMALVLSIAIWVGKKELHLSDNFQDRYLDLKITDVISNPVQAKIWTTRPPVSAGSASDEPMENILNKGILRVGYSTLDTPHAYLNRNNELVGYDIAYAYQLARELDCSLEFIPIHYPDLNLQLEKGEFDIAMSAIIMNEERIRYMHFTHPYEEENIVLVVPTEKRQVFSNLAEVIANPHLKLGAIGGFIFTAQRHFPNATVVSSENIEDLVHGKIDAWVSMKIHAFVWCLSHPGYDLIDYGGMIGKRYLAYPVHSTSTQWSSFLNSWLTLKVQSGFHEQMATYWLKGESVMLREPRWSVIHNVLHWID